MTPDRFDEMAIDIMYQGWAAESVCVNALRDELRDALAAASIHADEHRKAREERDEALRNEQSSAEAYAQLTAQVASMNAAIRETIAKADDYADSFISRPIRDLSLCPYAPLQAVRKAQKELAFLVEQYGQPTHALEALNAQFGEV